jgi:plasmid stabilization system protein ParE
MKIRYTPRARSDIEAIFAYIAKDNPQAALKVRRSILATIELVARHPYLGIKNARAPDLRSRLVPRYPYRVHYLKRGPEILVLHIRHTARRPGNKVP